MAKKSAARLSTGELELLDVLWQAQALTIRQVQQALQREVGFTTVQTRLNRLPAKGHVRKSDTRPGLYTAVLKRDRVSRADLSSLVDRVTQGRVVPLIAHLVQDNELSDADLAEIRELIDQATARNQKGQ